MAWNDPKYSKSEVSQRFNLKELLGYEPSERQKKLFYDLAINKMVQRTANGNDIDGGEFQPYSPQYAKKKGVSVNAVDLILTGGMLESFEDSQTRQKNILKIKVASGEQTLKSYNHNVGDTLPKRTYFGFNDPSDLEDIVSRVNQERGQESTRKAQESQQRPMTMADLREAVNVIDLDFEGF